MTFITETEAAELEGIVPITPEQLALVKRRRQLMARKDVIEAELNEIRDSLRKDLEENGQTGLTHNGKVVVRRTELEVTRIDGKALKEKYPEVATEVTIVSQQVRINVN